MQGTHDAYGGYGDYGAYGAYGGGLGYGYGGHGASTPGFEAPESQPTEASIDDPHSRGGRGVPNA